jgi:hypothetical protein
MAGRVISRRALREGHDQAARAEEAEETTTDESPEADAKSKKPRGRKPSAPKTAKVKAPPKPRARKRTAKVPPRMFARWAVCDTGLKHLAVFEYKDRAGADDKLAEMLGRKPGAYFLQLVKIPYNPPPVAEPAGV